jgi:hypothetical protein
VKLQVLTAVDINTAVFWDETPYILIYSDVSEEIATSILGLEYEAARQIVSSVALHRPFNQTQQFSRCTEAQLSFRLLRHYPFKREVYLNIT